MPSAHIVRETHVEKTPRVQQMSAMFDVPLEDKTRLEWNVDLPLDAQPWQVGLIVGPSGCGKSTIAAELLGDHFYREPEWSPRRSVLDEFPKEMSIKDVVGLLTAVGFSSPPSWVRPYHVLSNGEKFRVAMAHAIATAGDMTVVDEFTSVVDRQVAKVGSHTVQKSVRRTGSRFVAITCHYDVEDWLQPDWVYRPDTGEFTWRSVQPRPRFELEIRRVDVALWSRFAQHHYLSRKHHIGAVCHGGFIDGRCVAFSSYLHFPHPRKNIKMGHRTVVLPDWQGLGIGRVMLNWTGQKLYDEGFQYFVRAAHRAMKMSLMRSPRWKLKSTGKQNKPTKRLRQMASGHKHEQSAAESQVWRFLANGFRVASTFVYVPPLPEASDER